MAGTERNKQRRVEMGMRGKQGPGHEGPWRPYKNLDLYSEQDGKPVEAFEHRDSRDYFWTC